MFRIALILLATVAIVSGGISRDDDAKPLSKEQLAELLGTDSPSLLIWTKTTGADFYVYHGEPQPPLSGVVHIYVGCCPPFVADASLPTLDGRLGSYSVKWQKKVLADASLQFETVTALHSDLWKAHIVVKAKSQYDADRVFEEISRLRMFTQMPTIPGTP